ncbi:unnamed protein product, partial [Mesorhabditis spiculigera]
MELVCLPAHVRERILHYIGYDDLESRFRLARCGTQYWEMVKNVPRHDSKYTLTAYPTHFLVHHHAWFREFLYELDSEATVDLLFSRATVPELILNYRTLDFTGIQARTLTISRIPGNPVSFLEELRPEGGFDKIATWGLAPSKELCDYATKYIQELEVNDAPNLLEWLSWKGMQLELATTSAIAIYDFADILIEEWLGFKREIIDIYVRPPAREYLVQRTAPGFHRRSDGLKLMVDSNYLGTRLTVQILRWRQQDDLLA